MTTIQLILTIIPIVTATVAVILSYFAYKESITKRKSDRETIYLKRRLDQCDEALGYLVFDNQSITKDAVCFKQYIAAKMIIEKNLLSLDSTVHKDYIRKLKYIEKTHEERLRKRTGGRDTSEDTTRVVYVKEDFPEELGMLYSVLKRMAQAEKRNIMSRLEE